MKKTRHWLNTNKVFFEVFSYLIIGFSGIFISYIQYDLSNREYKLNKKQTEPLLKVVTEISKSDTTNYYTQESIVVSNEGGPIKRYSQEIKTFYKVEFHCGRCPEPIIAYIPINGYFNSTFHTRNIKERLTTSTGHLNLYYYNKLYSEFIIKSQREGPNFVDKIHLLKASYTDINDEKHTTYFLADNVYGGIEISEEFQSKIQKSADSLFLNSTFGYDSITFEKSWKITHK